MTYADGTLREHAQTATPSPRYPSSTPRPRRTRSLRSASDPDVRRRILDDLLGSFGGESEIRAPLYCDYGYQIHIGARTFVNFGLMALDVATIMIGDDVQIGPNVQLLTPTHPIDAELRRAK